MFIDGIPEMYTGYTEQQLESCLAWIEQISYCPVQYIPTSISKDVRKEEIHLIQLHNKAILKFFDTLMPHEKSSDHSKFEHSQRPGSFLQEGISSLVSF